MHKKKENCLSEMLRISMERQRELREAGVTIWRSQSFWQGC